MSAMPHQKNPPDRDARGETRQKYANRMKRRAAGRTGRLPPHWDVLPKWPNGLDGATWENSTQFWQLQHLKGQTSGTFYGRFPPDRLELAYRWAAQLARAVKLGFMITPSGDMEFSIHEPLVSPAQLEEDQETPVRDGVFLVRANDACEQFNAQAAANGIKTQKFDSFRRWLWRHGVRKHRIGGIVWHDVNHINEVLRALHDERAPEVRAGEDAPLVRERRPT